MQIGGESIKNLLRTLVLEKKNLKQTQIQNTHFHVFLFGNNLNKFQFGIVRMTTYNLWNLKLSYLNQLHGIIVTKIEVITINNQSWLSIHVYVLEEWKRVSILLNLQGVVDEVAFNNSTSLIVKILMEFGGLNEKDLANKLVCFGANGVIVFQGVKNGVIAQIMQKHAPFVSGVHCMAHRTNPVI